LRLQTSKSDFYDLYLYDIIYIYIYIYTYLKVLKLVMVFCDNEPQNIPKRFNIGNGPF